MNPQPEIRISSTGMEVQVSGPDTGSPEWRPVKSVTNRPGFMGMTVAEYEPVIAENERILRSHTGAIHIIRTK